MVMAQWSFILYRVGMMVSLLHHSFRTRGASALCRTPLRRLAAKERDDTTSSWETPTLEWVKRVVIGLNLCPFAKRPLREKQLHTRVALHREDAITVLQSEMEILLQQQQGTTLVILPHLTCFDDYWEFVQSVEEDIIAKNDWQGMIQVAPFHPEFVFEGSKQDDADNYTNRSPFPMIHILREDDVSEAVATLEDGNAGSIWSRNVDLLQTMANELDEDEFQTVVKGHSQRSLGYKVRAILRRYPSIHTGDR